MKSNMVFCFLTAFLLMMLLAQCKKEKHQPTALVGTWEGQIEHEKNLIGTSFAIKEEFNAELSLKQDARGVLFYSRTMGLGSAEVTTDNLTFSNSDDVLEMNFMELDSTFLEGTYTVLKLTSDSLLLHKTITIFGGTEDAGFVRWRLHRRE